MKGSVALAPFGKIAGMYLSTWKVCISYLSLGSPGILVFALSLGFLGSLLK